MTNDEVTKATRAYNLAVIDAYTAWRRASKKAEADFFRMLRTVTGAGQEEYEKVMVPAADEARRAHQEAGERREEAVRKARETYEEAVAMAELSW